PGGRGRAGTTAGGMDPHRPVGERGTAGRGPGGLPARRPAGSRGVRMRRASIGVFVLALGLRLAFLALGPGWHLGVADLDNDAPDYNAIAVSLAHGTGYERPWPGAGPAHGEVRPTAFRAPLLPYTLAALYKVTGTS